MNKMAASPPVRPGSQHKRGTHTLQSCFAKFLEQASSCYSFCLITVMPTLLRMQHVRQAVQRP